MSVEHETKFSLPDCRTLESILERLGNPHTPWHFEANTVYDRDGELEGSRRLLRLRRALTSTLTFKEPLPGPGTAGVKSRREIDSTVGDAGAMHDILCGLGYRPHLRYEKFRSEWDLGGGIVCLDILPFGHFVEIEAQPDRIGDIARDLGLDMKSGTAANYNSLYRQWCAQRGIAAPADFVFNPAERERLAALLGCSAQLQGESDADRHPA